MWWLFKDSHETEKIKFLFYIHTHTLRDGLAPYGSKSSFTDTQSFSNMILTHCDHRESNLRKDQKCLSFGTLSILSSQSDWTLSYFKVWLNLIVLYPFLFDETPLIMKSDNLETKKHIFDLLKETSAKFCVWQIICITWYNHELISRVGISIGAKTQTVYTRSSSLPEF